MSDYDELTNLIAAYGHIYDDGRLEEWTELFKHGSYSFFGKEFRGRAIVAHEDGARVATPLLAALLAVALADVIFAIDSIPAVLAITTDTFLVFAANAFALLGLRALYFLLDGMAQKFEYLHYGLGALLVFVGVKMLVEDIVGHLPVGVSLGVIVAVLGASVGASLLLSGRRSTTAA